MADHPARPFDQKTGDAICERMATGESLRAICRSEGMPSAALVIRWAAENAVFGEQYAHAQDLRVQTIADEMFEIADDARNDFMEKLGDDGQAIGWRENGELVRRSALRIDTRKWALARMAPKKYGDRLNVDQKSEVTVKEELDLSHLTKREREVWAGLVAKAKGVKP